jgi:hypothetical protein
MTTALLVHWRRQNAQTKKHYNGAAAFSRAMQQRVISRLRQQPKKSQPILSILDSVR